MILKLRQWHRRLFIVLGIFLPIAFAAGIVARKPMGENVTLVKVLVGTSNQFTLMQWQRDNLFAKSSITINLLRSQSNADQFAVELFTDKDFLKPDMLVYWVEASTNATDKVPENAILLGGLNPAIPLLLPRNAVAMGKLILYSLANQEIVDVSQPITLR